MDSKFKQGRNNTGIILEPQKVELMLDACKEFPADVSGSEQTLEKERTFIVKNAFPIGSFPSNKNKDKKNNLEWNTLIDKLSERLAFERTGVRFYEAAIAKCKAFKTSASFLKELEHIKKEEKEHMNLVQEAIQFLGGDSTALTPSADLCGVQGQGFLQVITDPRTNLAQTLEALLNLEIIDNAAWELLLALVQQNGQESLLSAFHKAYQQEEEHKITIQTFLNKELNISNLPSRKEDAYHILPHEGGGWDIKRTNAKRTSKHCQTKKEALALAREMSMKAGLKLYFHDLNTKH